MTDTAWLDDEEQEAWRSYIEATVRVRRECESELQAATDLSEDDYGTMVMLSEAEGRSARMVDVAAFLGTSPSRVTYRIDRLVKMGYVRRDTCPSDRRGSLAVLTDEGFAALAEAAPVHVDSVRRHLLDHISRDDLFELGRILGPVADLHRQESDGDC
jgi:DNA-binding MarR family transcriptional regulator